MGFTDNLNKVSNPATVYLRWKGKAEKVREDGVEKVEGGKLVYWDKEAEEEKEVALPITFCPLEITSSYTGYIPNKGRLWSNEILDFTNGIINVHMTGEDDQIICSGTYEEIKDKAFSSGAKLQSNVYAWCKQLGGIVRFNLVGSAKTAWKDFTKKVGRGKIYECPVQMSVGEPEESPLGQFVPPKFSLGAAYTDDVIKNLTEKDKEVIDYLKYLSERPAIQQETSDIVPEDIPENVSNVMGNGVEDASDEIDLSSIPF